MSVTTNQVRRVMRASVWARRISTGVMMLMVAGMIWATFVVLTASADGNAKAKVGRYLFSAVAMQSWAVKVWLLIFVAVMGALGLTFVHMLRSIFTNLARGEIFCHPNVRRIRSLGLVIIVGGIVQWVTPFVTTVYFMFVGYDKISSREIAGPTNYSFEGVEPFAYGALMILLSWIMAVGLGVREDAEELRRDAELVI